MASLADRLHCIRCKGRLNSAAADADPAALFCPQCEMRYPAPHGIPDFTGNRPLTGNDPAGLFGNASGTDSGAAAPLDRLRLAAGERWPASLGDVLELGCGAGELTPALAAHEAVASVLAADSDAAMLRACRDRLAEATGQLPAKASLARLSMAEDALRDAVFDTVIAAGALARVGDVPALLAMVHRVLRPGGHAVFLAPNRRYLLAACHALAEALVLRHAREQAWPDAARAVIRMIGTMHRRHVHQGDAAALANVRDRNMFDAEALEDVAREAGFAEVSVQPVQPDPWGGETMLRLCQAAGVDEGFAGELAPLAVAAGAPYFSLLGRQAAGASLLVWLTKGVGPSLRTFAAPPPQRYPFRLAEAALGGLPPRWSIEATAQETPDGVQVALDGWCLVNADVVWLRFAVGDVVRTVTLGGARPDVHDVLNRQGLYRALYPLTSGLRATLLFDGAHAVDGSCALRIEVVLMSGVVVQAPAPRTLVLNETVTLAQ